jgi:hypothetical protein
MTVFYLLPDQYRALKSLDHASDRWYKALSAYTGFTVDVLKSNVCTIKTTIAQHDISKVDKDVEVLG